MIKELKLNSHIFLRPSQGYARHFQREEELAAKWMQSLPKPIGVFACDDNYGRFISRICKIAKISVPEQLAVLGVDNDDLVCELSDPPLSSIVINSEKAGYQAAILLEKLMSGMEMPYQRIEVEPTTIVTRQSTDILAIEDAEVAKALHFIRENASVMIQVNDVVTRTTISRKALYQRFNKAIGRSIHEEITRTRMDKFSQLLQDTDMTISEIAHKMGHSSDKHIARNFHKIKGMTPKEYRKKFRIMAYPLTLENKDEQAVSS